MHKYFLRDLLDELQLSLLGSRQGIIDELT